MTLAILAVWVGVIMLVALNSSLGVFAPGFALIMTLALFIIGFKKK